MREDRLVLTPKIGDVVLYELHLQHNGSGSTWTEVRVGKMVDWSAEWLSVIIDQWDKNRFRGRTTIKTRNILEIGKSYKGVMRDYPEYFI